MTAARAFQVGMVSEVVPRAELMPRAMDLAEIIASQDLRGLMGTVEVLYKSRELGISDAIVQGLAIRELSGRAIGQAFTHPTSS